MNLGLQASRERSERRARPLRTNKKVTTSDCVWISATLLCNSFRPWGLGLKFGSCGLPREAPGSNAPNNKYRSETRVRRFRLVFFGPGPNAPANMQHRTHGSANEQTNGRTDEPKTKQTKKQFPTKSPQERTNEGTNERTHERTNQRSGTQTQRRTHGGANERTNERTNGRTDEQKNQTRTKTKQKTTLLV